MSEYARPEHIGLEFWTSCDAPEQRELVLEAKAKGKPAAAAEGHASENGCNRRELFTFTIKLTLVYFISNYCSKFKFYGMVCFTSSSSFKFSTYIFRFIDSFNNIFLKCVYYSLVWMIK